VENGIQKNPAEFYKHLSLFWTDLIYLMSSKPQALTSVGPMRSFAANAKKISVELLDSNDDLVEFNKRLTGYYQQLADTWAIAQKKVNAKMPEVPNDQEQFEAYMTSDVSNRSKIGKGACKILLGLFECRFPHNYTIKDRNKYIGYYFESWIMRKFAKK